MANGFTENAALYLTSRAHAELPDLEVVEDFLPDLGGAVCLDVACGAGHTAFFLAGRQAHVFAVDINEEMLRVAQEESDRRTLSVRFLKSPANDLLFDDDNFDLVTCRLATHHFTDIEGFLREAVRVLKPAGQLLLIDNVVPEESAVADWLNGFEKDRDPSHAECLSPERWKLVLEKVGLEVTHSERFSRDLEYLPWMQRMSFDQQGCERMWMRLVSAPPEVKSYWNPRENPGGQKILTMQRQIMLAG